MTGRKIIDFEADMSFTGGAEEQGCAASKPLAALAGKVRLAVAGKFPIIPKGYSGLVEQLLAVPSHWWNYGELWGIMVELWGIMGNYEGIMGEFGWNYGEIRKLGYHFLCC